MQILILKLGATGDVVRTTPLLRRFVGDFTWITAAKNVVLLQQLQQSVRCFSWEDRDRACDRTYDLVISLEDTKDVGDFATRIGGKKLFGAYLNAKDQLCYTDDSRSWFDLILISVHGKAEADRLKAKNRRTYQELIFEGLGFQFKGERYALPDLVKSELKGDVAIAP